MHHILHRSACTAIATATLLASTIALGADAQTGRQRAQLCSSCHGPMGVAAMPLTPNLAGQPEPYLAAQLKAYRDGKRQHEIMSLIAKPLTDAEIADLAAWYASIQIAVVEKP